MITRPHIGRRTFVAGCGAALFAASRAARAQELLALRLGCAPSEATTATIYADRSGLFRRSGLNVTIQQMTSGAAIAAAVAGGALDIGESSLAGLITAHVRGLPFQLVSPNRYYLSSAPNELLVVKRDGPLRSAADLNGKTIASPAISDLLSLSTLAWIDLNGGDSKTVKSIELPPSATMAAIQIGRIDAAFLYEPYLSEGLGNGTYRSIGKPYDAIGPRFLAAVNFATTDYANANRDVVRRYYAVMHEANAYTNTHRSETAPLAASWTGMALATIQRSSRVTYANSLNPAEIQPMIEAMVRFRLIPKSFDARELISPIVGTG